VEVNAYSKRSMNGSEEWLSESERRGSYVDGNDM
jgi:hypothetical protein